MTSAHDPRTSGRAPRRTSALLVSLASLAAASALIGAQSPPAGSTPPPRVRPATPPVSRPATPPAAPPIAPQPEVDQPSHAGDANASIPEGLRVRHPGRKPEFKGGPALYFEELDHDFGAMTNAETRSHRFAFVNAGDQPLVVERVVPKCGCTKPRYTPNQTVQPGERGYIDVDFTPPTGGHQAKALTVVSNAMWPVPQGEEWNIRVIANVESVLSFEPKFTDVGEVSFGKPLTTEFEVKADADATIFDSVESRSPELTAAFVGDGPHKGSVKVKVDIGGNMPWGLFRSGVLMLTTRGKTEGGEDIRKTLPLRVTGTVVDDIRASEYILQFGVVRPGQDFTQSVFVYHKDGKDFELMDVIHEPLAAGMKGVAAASYNPVTAVKETRDGVPGYVITLSGNAGSTEHGFLTGSVRFSTKLPGESQPSPKQLAIGGRIMSEAVEKRLPPGPGRR